MGWLCNLSYQSRQGHCIHLIMKLKNWQKLLLVCFICAGLVTMLVFIFEKLN